MTATVFSWLYHAVRWTWHDPDGYNFLSGPLADITLLGAGYAILRRHNCHAKRCLRVGMHPVHGTSYIVCRKHHPHARPTAEQIHDEHYAATASHVAEATATAAERAAASARAVSDAVEPQLPDH